MEDEPRMAGEPAQHLGVLVGGVVVEDDVDHLAGRHGALDGVEEADEFLMPVALHAVADHRALEHVEGGEQGRGAVALVVEGHACPALPFFIGSPGWVRSSAWIWLFSSTDSTTACAGGSTYRPTMSWSLAANSGSLDSLKRLDAVRLQAVRRPDPLHRAQRDAGRRGHRPAGPVGRLAGRLAQGQLDHPLDHRLGQRRLARRPALVAQQPVHPLGHEPLLPAPDRRLGAADLAHDRQRAHAVGAQQHDPRPLDMLLPAVAIRHDRLEPSTITGGDLDLDPLAHPGTVA